MNIAKIPTDNLVLLWQETGEGIRLLRAFGNSPALTLPDCIGGRAITEIGPYCFSASRPRFSGAVHGSTVPQNDADRAEIFFEDGTVLNAPDFDFSRFGTELDGKFLEEIVLPSGITTLHNAAFYNCRKLVSLSVGTAIGSIGSDEFTNDLRLANLTIRGCDSDRTGLSLLLERIAEDITVRFVPEGADAPECVLFFPEYYEWLDEISPAHIFSRSIHGEGFRLRKSFEGGVFSHAKYDACFENALVGESADSILRIALGRLRTPSHLGEKYQAAYEQAVRERLGQAFSLAVRAQDFSLLSFLCETFSPDSSVLSEALTQSTAAEWGEGSAFLIERRHRTFCAKTFDFDLDF